MNENFETAKAYLQKVDKSGRTVYDHITSVILDIVKDKPENPLEAFESISVRIKSAATDPTVYKEIPSLAESSAEFKKLHASVKATANLISPEYNDDDEEPEPMLIPDIVAESQLLEGAGVNLGAEEVYKLTLSIQRFASVHAVEDVRFVGKIFGTHADYYVIEGRPLEFPEEAEESDATKTVEPWGEGANETVFYVTNSPESAWTALPQLQPDWVTVARASRRFFTGNLAAPVPGFPHFVDNEAAYLRAQLQRIVAATWVSPKGFYVPDDAANELNDVVRKDEEYDAAADPGELLFPDSWAHHRAHILKQGRTTPWVDPDAAEDEDQPSADAEEPEEPIPKLRSVAEDDHGYGPLSRDSDQTGSWTFRVQPAAHNPYAAVVAASLAWPGAVAVAKGKAVVNVYVGYGQKHLGGKSYTPPAPPAIQAEYVAAFNEEEGEANPLEEQNDPEPPKDAPEDEDGEDGDEGDFEGDDLDDDYHN